MPAGAVTKLMFLTSSLQATYPLLTRILFSTATSTIAATSIAATSTPPPTPPGEDLADSLYNTVGDFLVLVWVLLDYLKWSQKPSQSLIDGLARFRTEIFPYPRKLHP